ncbi:MAG: hypothetical protein KBD90_06690, partial [Alphaproteobacteria bacterium]|nr:hypothetical protein [Alphaproteobacteria bacterium]
MKEYALNQKDIGARIPSPQPVKIPYHTWDPKVAVIRKELVVLTGDTDIAVVLNQLLYWSQRVKDYDLLIDEEQSLFHKAVLDGEEENEGGRLSLSSP